jgi:outer membrane protein assembly factor BamA
VRILVKLVTVIVLAGVQTLFAQEPPSDAEQAAPATTRQGLIEQEQAEKSKELQPYKANGAERVFQRVDTILEGGTLRWHPFFDNAYSGGGFTLGAGHATYVSAFNYVDVRGSWTFSNYKRFEAEFVAPRLFNRRAQLSAIGGWRDATQVGFYGVGNDSVKEDRTNYRFTRPYGNALFTIFPVRKGLMLQGGTELTDWQMKPGQGSFPSIDTKYTSDTLPGVGEEVTYFHNQGSVGFDWRTSPGYTRRGGVYTVTLHDFNDVDDQFGFRMLEYEAIQHVPILRETWVLSFRGRMQHVLDENSGEQIPFFMLPSLGGGSTLRGYSSWRFRDRNSLLLQAEWRIMVNRYLDMSFFYDAGKVAARSADLDLNGLKDDFGIEFRFHGPFNTPLRMGLARSPEGTEFIFSSSAAF